MDDKKTNTEKQIEIICNKVDNCKNECHDHHKHDEERNHGHHHYGNEVHECHDHHKHDEEHNHGHHHHDHEVHECHAHHKHEQGNVHHGHDHHHEHNEGTVYDVEGFELLETHSHEGASICSFEKMVDAETVIDANNTTLLDGKIKELIGWLEKRGAVIGHIKGYIKAAEENMTFSTTGSGINYAEHKAENRKFAFAAIVIGVSEEELKDEVIKIFSEIK